MAGLDSKTLPDAIAASEKQASNCLLRSGNRLRGMGKREPISDVLADNLGRLMKARGINSQPELHKLSKVSQKTINNIFNRRNAPQLDTVEKLAGALKVELYQLLCPVSDIKFLAVCLAWAQSDDRGREDLSTIAEAILKRRESNYQNTSSTTMHRGRDGGA